MEYRKTKFYYKEWRTWDDKPAGEFYCDDSSLLEFDDTINFAVKTLDEMHETIDYYLDNVEKYKSLRDLNSKAIKSTYENDNYKLD
tara:strand:- start:764 stop:1021 length:258 start_codon:yes stop_codon:yes gene_type:complete